MLSFLNTYVRNPLASCILHPVSCLQTQGTTGDYLMKRLLILAFLIFVLTSGAVRAQQEQSNTYLPKGSVDGVALIGPPAEIDSAEFNTQMAIVLWLQKTRTPGQVEFVSKPLNLARFTPIIDAELLKVDGKELRSTLASIIEQVRNDYDQVKAHYNLSRPFSVNDEFKPVSDARPVGSYPSGHATRATVYARILSEIFPDKKDELTELGLQIGYGRVIAGVHYPMDVTSGQKLGNAYADVIIKQDSFKEALLRIQGN